MTNELTISILGRSQNAVAALKAVEANLTAVRRAAGQTGAHVSAGLAGAGNAIRGLTPALEITQRLFGQIAGAGKLASGALGHLTGVAGSLLGMLGNIAGGVGNAVINVFQGIATAAGVAGTAVGGALAAGLIAIGKTGLGFNATMSQGRIGLEAITGDSAKAGAALAQFGTFAEASLLTLQDVVTQGTQLGRALGKEGFAQVLPAMKAFDDAAKVNQVSIENTRNAMLQFRQLIQKDFAQQEELNSIGENMGVNVSGMLRQKFGTADTEELKAAGVSGRQVAQALVEGMNAEFGGQAASMGRNLAIVLSGFEDTFGKLAGRVTEAFGPRLAAGLDKILTSFGRLADSGRLVAALEVPFTLVSRAIDFAAEKLPDFVGWLEKIVTRENVVEVLAQAVGWVKTLGQEVGRFVGAATGDQGLGGVFTNFQGIAEKAIDDVLRGWNVLVSSVKFLSDHAGEIWGVFTEAMGPAQKALDALIGGVTVLVGMAAGGKVAELFGGIGSAVGVLGNMLGGAKKGAGEVASGTISKPGAPGGGPGIMGAIAKFLPNVSHVEVTNQQGQGPGEIMGRKFLGDKQYDALLRAVGGKPAAAAKPGGGLSVPGVAGSALEGLSGLGAQIRGELAKGVGEAAAHIPAHVKNLWNSFQGQAQQAWNEGGLDALRKRQGANATQARGQINSLLGATGAPAAAPGSDLPAAPMLYGGGAQGGASVNGVPAGAGGGLANGKKLDEILKARTAYFDSLIEQAKTLAGMSPESERSQTEALRIIPALQAKQQELVEQAKRVKRGSDDFFKLSKEYYDLQGQITHLQSGAAKEQESNVKKSREEQAKGLDLAIKLQEARIEALGLDPEQEKQAKHKMLVPALLEKLKALAGGPRQGETANEQMEREMARLGVRKDILEAEGMGAKDRQQAQLLGGGTLALYDQRKFQNANRYLDQVEVAGGPSPVLSQLPKTQQSGGGDVYNFTIPAPAGPLSREQFLRYMMDVAGTVFDQRERETSQRSARFYAGSPYVE